MPLIRCVALSLMAGLAAAQAGDRSDRKGVEQKLPYPGLESPPAPVLTPLEALRSIEVQDGCRVELVAAEPLVVAPVTAVFGPDRRLWVVEMRAYMPNIDGTGETEPNGVVAVLEDRDGDGRMDSRTVFLDGLVLPRAIALVDDGVLVLEPPQLWFCRDADGDGRCDSKDLVGDGFKAGIANPEHAANSPRFGLDGAIYFAKYGRRLRRESDGSWSWSEVSAGGQWGLSRDDFGRWFFNNNSNFARGHLAAPYYARRNRHLQRPAFVGRQLAKTQKVWSSRVNLGVNRAYRKGTLQRDGRLARFTGACGALLYRGDALGDGFYGDLFVCEPAGNFVRRAKVVASGATFEVANACENREFVSSSDERFRPVDVLQGPDDSVYVVDMYRGVIQHRNFVTTYLRRHVAAQKLEQPLECGRIYRIIGATKQPFRSAPRLDSATREELVAALGHRSGWRRDAAQQLLVERGERAATAALRDRALSADASSAVRVQSLFTLAGLGTLDRATLFRALEDGDALVRASAVRLCDARLTGCDRAVDEIALIRLGTLASDPDARVRLQLALTLGEVDASRPRLRDEADAVLVELLGDRPSDSLRDAVISGLAGRELAFVERLLGVWTDGDRSSTLRRLASCVARRRVATEVESLLARAAVADQRHRLPLLQGALDGLPRKGAKKLRVSGEPRALLDLARDEDAKSRANRVLAVLEWTEQPRQEGLSGEARVAFDRGAELYAVRCIACHLANGEGSTVAPPLLESEWVLGPSRRLARILLHGIEGPIEVAGVRYELAGMVPNQDLGDADVAAIMTYVRRAWTHRAEPVDAAIVREVRAANEGRNRPWTAAELARDRY